MCEIVVLTAVLPRMQVFEGVVLCHLVLPNISERYFRKYQMTERHITEDLKFQRLSLFCGVDVMIERMDGTRLPKIMIHWKPEGTKEQSCPWRTWRDGIYTAMNGRDLRMGEWHN
jgi:hypothetical protein